jgi:hypothetical protein
MGQLLLVLFLWDKTELFALLLEVIVQELSSDFLPEVFGFRFEHWSVVMGQ